MIYRLVILVCIVFSAVINATAGKYCDGNKVLVSEQDSLVFYSLFDELSVESESGGKISFNNDSRIMQLLELHRKKSFSKKGFYGYRIQIYSESSIDADIKSAENYKAAFEKVYPETRVYLKYFNPDFKIRVGNFRSKLECMSLLKRIKRKYPNCYPVKTFIYYHELKKKEVETE